MFYVYVLRSEKDDDLYIGSTSNLKARIKKHNKGEVRSTKLRKPLKLVYYEAYKAEYDARNREVQLKKRGQARVHLRNRISNSLQSKNKS